MPGLGDGPFAIPLGRMSLVGGRVVGSSTFTTTSTSYVDLTNATLTLTTQAARCLVSFSGQYQLSGSNTSYATINIDGTNVEGAYAIASGTVDSNGSIMSFTYLTDVLSAGSHTFKIQVHTNGLTLTVPYTTTAGQERKWQFSVAETAIVT